MATKEFLQKRIEGREKELTKLEKKLARIRKAEASNYEDNNPYYYDANDLRGCLKDIEVATAQLEKYQNELAQQIQKDDSRNVEVIVQFLNNWKAQCEAYYKEALPEFLEAYREYIKATNELNAQCKAISKDYYKRSRQLRDDFNKQWGFIREYVERGTLNEKKLSKDLEAEANRKYDFIIERTNEIVGTITDAQYLTIGDNGELNGYIIGTDGKASVKTIGAGGYNIQCYHFRTLIRKMK